MKLSAKTYEIVSNLLVEEYNLQSDSEERDVTLSDLDEAMQEIDTIGIY